MLLEGAGVSSAVGRKEGAISQAVPLRGHTTDSIFYYFSFLIGSKGTIGIVQRTEK